MSFGMVTFRKVKLSSLKISLIPAYMKNRNSFIFNIGNGRTMICLFCMEASKEIWDLASWFFQSFMSLQLNRTIQLTNESFFYFQSTLDYILISSVKNVFKA